MGVIGVDMGGTKLLAGAVGPDLDVHHRAQRSLKGLDQASLLDVAVDAAEEARRSSRDEVAAVGFGIPSLIDHRSGMAMFSVHLPLADIAFGDVMAERLGMPVFVDNDSNLAALAEHRAGACRGASEAVVITLGTGIGGGLVLRGELYRGATGTGAELGHTVIDLDGPLCQGNCPNRGCVEVLASGTALEREALRIAGERPESGLARALESTRTLTGPLVTELAHDGDAAAIEAVALIGSRLGVAIASLILGILSFTCLLHPLLKLSILKIPIEILPRAIGLSRGGVFVAADVGGVDVVLLAEPSGQAGRAKARSRFPGRNSPAPLPTKTIPRAIAGPPAIGGPGGDSQRSSPSRARQARSFPSIRPMKTTPPATESGPNWKAGSECSQRMSPVAASIPATMHVLSA